MKLLLLCRGSAELVLKVLINVGFVAIVVFGQESPITTTAEARALENTDELAKLDTLIKNEPSNVALYCNRAQMYCLLKQYDKAIADINRAISLEPKVGLLYVNKAAICLQKEDYPSALQSSNKALALNPKLAEAYLNRGLVYGYLKKYNKQIEDYSSAIALRPNSSGCYLQRARAFRKSGNYKEALLDCNKAVTLCSQDAEAYIERASVFLCLKKFPLVIQDCSKACVLSPSRADSYSLRAEAFSNLGQYKREIEDLTASCRLESGVAKEYRRRAFSYYQLAQLENAVTDCIKATEIEPNSPYAYKMLGAIYEELGLYRKAIKMWTKSIALAPKDSLNWSRRANAYQLLEELDLAKVDWVEFKKRATPTELAITKLCYPLIDFDRLPTAYKSPKSFIDRQLRDKAIVFDFTYDKDGHMFLPVEMNNRVLRLILDTGCDHSELWTKAISGVARSSIIKLEGLNANGKKYSYGVLNIKGAELGGLRLKNLPICINDGLTGHDDLSGFLSGNILENFVVSIDYKKRQVTLMSSANKIHSPQAIVLQMRIRDHSPYCFVRINRTLEVAALLDTGSPFSLAPDSILMPAIKKKLEYSGSISGPWLGTIQSTKIDLNEIGLGQVNFREQSIEVFPSEQAPAASTRITLGNDFLRRFRSVTFDYPGRRIIFEP